MKPTLWAVYARWIQQGALAVHKCCVITCYSACVDQKGKWWKTLRLRYRAVDQSHENGPLPTLPLNYMAQDVQNSLSSTYQYTYGRQPH